MDCTVVATISIDFVDLFQISWSCAFIVYLHLKENITLSKCQNVFKFLNSVMTSDNMPLSSGQVDSRRCG